MSLLGELFQVLFDPTPAQIEARKDAERRRRAKLSGAERLREDAGEVLGAAGAAAAVTVVACVTVLPWGFGLYALGRALFHHRH